jgi:hypothetical protein
MKSTADDEDFGRIASCIATSAVPMAAVPENPKLLLRPRFLDLVTKAPEAETTAVVDVRRKARAAEEVADCEINRPTRELPKGRFGRLRKALVRRG